MLCPTVIYYHTPAIAFLFFFSQSHGRCEDLSPMCHASNEKQESLSGIKI